MPAEPDPSLQRVVLDLISELRPNEDGPLGRDALLSSAGFDSLACADLALAVEERLGVRLPDAEVAGFKTVGEVIDTVGRGVAARIRLPENLGRLQPLTKKMVGPLLRMYTRMRIRGAENVPRSGPLVIAANHRSMLDIPVMVVASPRPAFFMGKRELFGDPLRARLWIELGGFPVRREIADIRSLDMALALLERGEALVLYPEGTRSRTAKMLPFLEGTAWLALRLGAPVVPAGVIGTGREPGWNGKPSPWLGKHVLVSYGRPIEVEVEANPHARRQKAIALTDELLSRIGALMG